MWLLMLLGVAGALAAALTIDMKGAPNALLAGHGPQVPRAHVTPGTELLATHVRATQKGTWRTIDDHLPPDKLAYLQKTPAFCREIAFRIGPATFEVVDLPLGERPLDRLRSVQAILRLTESVGKTRLEAAYQRALFYGDPRYKRIKDILNAARDQQPLPQPEESPALLSYAFARSAEELFGIQARPC